MLSQQAVANHLDSSPEVIRQLALDRNQILSNAEFARLKDQAKPTAEEISAYYSAHWMTTTLVDIRRVFIWSHAEGAKDSHGLTPQARHGAGRSGSSGLCLRRRAQKSDP